MPILVHVPHDSNRRRKRFTALALLLLVGAVGLAAEEILVAEVWVDRSPVLPAGVSLQASADDVAEALLREARYVFSGMIYGFEFRYTPSDNRRGVEQEFSLEPIAEIPWGDPRLRIMKTRAVEYRTYGRFYYHTGQDQQRRLAAWASSAIPSHSAEGSASLYLGRSAKYDAVEDAVRETIRDYLRARVYNKPREISGGVTLAEPPQLRIASGNYVARVKLKIRIDEVRDYRNY